MLGATTQLPLEEGCTLLTPGLHIEGPRLENVFFWTTPPTPSLPAWPVIRITVSCSPNGQTGLHIVISKHIDTHTHPTHRYPCSNRTSRKISCYHKTTMEQITSGDGERYSAKCIQEKAREPSIRYTFELNSCIEQGVGFNDYRGPSSAIIPCFQTICCYKTVDHLRGNEALECCILSDILDQPNTLTALYNSVLSNFSEYWEGWRLSDLNWQLVLQNQGYYRESLTPCCHPSSFPQWSHLQHCGLWGTCDTGSCFVGEMFPQVLRR